MLKYALRLKDGSMTEETESFRVRVDFHRKFQQYALISSF